MNTEQIYKLFKDSAGVTTDSRKVSENQLFFALWGDNYNGNKFASDALEKGASWAIIDDPLFESERTILVDDCLAELQALALHYRKQLNIPVIAITGTNGKTTTKELLAAILSRKFKVHSTKGNLNNQIGVPLTILSAAADTQIMIVEMGANHIGEIKALCQIAEPDYGLITNIGTAHIEGFGSFEGVVKAKTELYEYLRKINGVAFYNDKDHLLTEKIFKHINRAVPFSDPTGTLLTLEQEASDLNLKLKVTYSHQDYTINTNLFGEYNYWNIKAAIATGLFFEVDIKDIVSAIEQYVPSNNRSQVKQTEKNTLICDAYNANPSSMSKALLSFASLPVRPKIAILGDMLELGASGDEEHMKIIDILSRSGIDDAILVGKIFCKVTANGRYRTFNNSEELADHIKKNTLKGYHILIKGSRGIGLEKIYDLL